MIGMTVFFMRCCKKILNLISTLIFCISLCFYASAATAEGITVIKAKVQAVDDGFEIVADFKINLPPSVADALLRGVALNFVSELAITRSRWYWLDTDVVQSELSTKLSYNALTRQYRISRGTLFQSFANLDSALLVLGHMSTPPVPAISLARGDGYISTLLKGRVKHTATAQMRLDISQLPKPLQVTALTNSDWNLDSDRFSWTVDFDSLVHEQVPAP